MESFARKHYCSYFDYHLLGRQECFAVVAEHLAEQFGIPEQEAERIKLQVEQELETGG